MSRWCRICRFETEMDDVALRGPAGELVCLRCYSRETGNQLPMPRELRRELQVVLAETP